MVLDLIVLLGHPIDQMLLLKKLKTPDPLKLNDHAPLTAPYCALRHKFEWKPQTR